MSTFPPPSCLYRLRERSPSDLPNPIPAGCDREERKKRLERDLGRRESCPGGNISFVERESNKRAGCEVKELRQRRREERLEPEHEFRKRKEREAMANKENIQKNEIVGNRREIKENHRRSEGGRRVVRRHTSHKKEWRESFVTKRDSLEGDSSMLWTGNFERYQSCRKDKRRMSLKESMMVPECLASPGVHSDSGISSGTLSVIRGSQTFGADTWMTSLDDSMEGKNNQSSNRTFRSEGTSSKVYTNQERGEHQIYSSRMIIKIVQRTRIHFELRTTPHRGLSLCPTAMNCPHASLPLVRLGLI